MPPFVLEVVSRSSVRRDLEEKERLYRLLGVEEYAIVRQDLAEPRLEGYRQEAGGAWVPWVADADGRLWSGVLELWLVLHEGAVQAMTREGTLLLTPRQAEEARHQTEWERHQAERERHQAEREREQESLARQKAEQEVEQLRAALQRLTHGREATQPDDG